MKATRIIIVALAMAFMQVPAVKAQLTASRAFADAPASVFPLLNRNVRLDMIDYFNGGMTTASTNALQGKSRITALAPDDLKIAMTDASSYQLVILPAQGDSIIGLIQTVATPAHDSHITFYSRDWKQLDTNPVFTAPSLEDWLTPVAKKSGADISLVPFMLAGYVYDPSSSTLTLTNNLSEFLSPDVYSIVGGNLMPTIIYKWDGRKMTRSK